MTLGMARRARTQAVIPACRNHTIRYDCNRTIYKQRNVIKRMFCRLKAWRRIATRFDRDVKTFMVAVALAAAVIWWLWSMDPNVKNHPGYLFLS